MTNELRDRLRTDLWILDAMLTGKDPCNGRGGTVYPNDSDLEDFILGGFLYYLSDGGYSRLFCDRYKPGVIHVASESTATVKERFSDPYRCGACLDRLAATIKEMFATYA